ncbi:GntR family transcriptional regulator [Streptomyces sp. DSM 44917]|uniref:GntR family transcriptional regulator n=1 Tax=Streptomyces boetiae TaxID=3075541 RepID=A0ABU2LGT3_9ACTN|nr:GntR family transcriptional regulator [Streptomyces sp. DSM 44917]MDT0310462.1 GntR family transcriptional regulator [Streptomyces sp. DSM 44917]
MADSSSAGAPYLRVAGAIRDRIANGTWSPGDRLPSRGELGAEFGVGENVVRRAQELLIAEGKLEGRAGSGTYVRAPVVRRKLRRTPRPRSARSGVAPAGFSGTWEADSTAKVPAPPAIADRLGIQPGDPCVCTAYEFFTDRQPVMLTTSWEPMTITGGTVVVLPEGGPLAGKGVVDRMAHLGITVTRAVERPRPAQADRGQAHLLGITTGAQGTLIERIHYDSTGRAVETADIFIPADRWDIEYDVDMPAPNT